MYRTVSASNAFPVPVKEKVEELPMNTRANILLRSLKENCPNLYKQIKASR
jgi:hypothetical protein